MKVKCLLTGLSPESTGGLHICKEKKYSSTEDLQKDLRIEGEMLAKQPIELLSLLENHYPNQRVKKFYKLLKKELFK
jgi:hypothetical protein